jgi:hypothetical protein
VKTVDKQNMNTGHGGRDRMLKELGKKYANVTRDSIELFKSMCLDCQRTRVRPMTKGVGELFRQDRWDNHTLCHRSNTCTLTIKAH